ncbi:MAG: SprT-like domain-containing protein [Catalinimonas sp.]
MPAAAVAYCRRVASVEPFVLRITPPRRTKLGDYRWDSSHRRHRITVNQDLNPYHFLLTFLHELAHLHVRQRYGGRVAPHGPEWRRTFRELVEPLLKRDVFPKNLRDVVSDELARPRASAHAAPELVRALRVYDPATPGAPLPDLDSLPDGTRFRHRGRELVRLRARRTRVLTYEPAARRY